MTIATTLKHHLNEQGVAHELVQHEATSSSSYTAQSAHVSGNRLAKAVVLSDDGGYLLAVLPASHHLRLEWVEQLIGRPVTLAGEQEAGRLFPDCEVGAIPPVGQAYGVDVVLDDSLAGIDTVHFEGGDHRSLVKVAGADFLRLLEGARHGTISAHD